MCLPLQKNINFIFQLSNMMITVLCGCISAWERRFFFFSSSLHTLPKHFWFHQSKSFPHCSSFARIVLPKIPPSLDFQDASIVSPHLKLDSYISSKRKKIFFVGGTKPRGLIKRGEWFEVSQQRWWTRVLGNFTKKEFVAKPLSNLSQIDRPS